MVRHYAFTHKKLYELTDVIPENLVGSQNRVITIPGTRRSGKTPAKEKHTDGRLLDSNSDDEDIKVQRITDMVVERLQKNVREASEKTCETPEEKDNEHDKDKESDVVKPREKDGMVEKYGDGVNNNGSKAPISINFKKISLPDSPTCEPDKTKKDKHRQEEEKKRSRVKIDPRSQ